MHRLILSLIVAMGLAACADGGANSTRPGATGAKYPYGKPVPGKEGLVYSPYSDSEVYIDVRGFERGIEVRDPWTDKIFLVP